MEIVLRKATEEDRESVIAVETKATPSLSYVPRVFDMFNSDEEGEFLVAEADGEVVACGKFTVVPDGSAWLETLRVIPAYQGLGIGKRFYERFFEIARDKGVKTMRMYTGLRNVVSKGLAERFGFRIAAARRGAWLHCRSGESENLLPVAESFQLVASAERAVDLLMPQCTRWEDFLVMNRTFYALTPALCADLAEKGQVYEDPETGSVITLGARFMPETALHIGVFAGDPGACLGFALSQGIAQESERLNCLFPVSDGELQDTFIHYGFQFETSDFIVMEVHLDD